MKHGNDRFYIKDEKWQPTSVCPRKHFSERSEPNESSPNGCQSSPSQEPTFQYCRLFPKGETLDEEKFKEQVDALKKLATFIETEKQQLESSELSKDSNIPAGYTYLGQFIAHDITLEKDPLKTNGEIDLSKQENSCNPCLTLDSLYGEGPESKKSQDLYEKDKKKFKIGLTQGNEICPNDYLNDLPRKGDNSRNSEEPTDAIIADPRNDDNLVVAQTTLAFLKFHNALVYENPGKSFEEIRRKVTLYYQAIILYDYLPQILYKGVLDDVLQYGRKFYKDDKDKLINKENEKVFVPIEFSVAAYRMGHSMIRPSYEWNQFHNSTTNNAASLLDFFTFSSINDRTYEEKRNLSFTSRLPSDWIIDWERFYDFKKKEGKQLNYARKLDTNMAMELNRLPQFQLTKERYPSLITRDLLRGLLVSLPTGQAVAKAIGETLAKAKSMGETLSTPPVSVLTPEQIRQDSTEELDQFLQNSQFDTNTPLWYYIQRESMIEQEGNRLGIVGSYIVAETFVGLIEHSKTNILDPKVKEELPDLKLESFSMLDLLKRIPNHIDPLGDPVL
jgi:hypothetical protein